MGHGPPTARPSPPPCRPRRAVAAGGLRPPRVLLTDVVGGSGITLVNTTGDPDRKDYIFEVKGGGVGALDYDNDGWVDLVFSRGSSLERWRKGDDPAPRPLPQPGRRHVRGRHRGRPGLTRAGWGVGVQRRRLRQRRLRRPLPHEPRPGRPLPQQRGRDVHGRHREGRHPRAGLELAPRPSATSTATATSTSTSPPTSTWARRLPEGGRAEPAPTSACPSCAAPAACPEPGILYFHNNGNGTFTEQSEASGAFDKEAYFGLGVVTSDLDGDGDLDLYVGNDAMPNYLFVNRGDGRFDERGFQSGTAVSGDGNEQASMGVDAADYDNDGRPDLYAAHFASDYSTLYRNLGGLLFEDVTARARIKDPAGPT